MQNLNKKVIFLSFAITTLILFGGWFGFQFMGTEKPIRDYLQQKDNLEIIELNIDQRKIDLVIKFIDDQNFAQSYVELEQFLTELARGKELHLSIDPSQGEHHPWWLAHSALLLEDLSAEKYTQIGDSIQLWINSGILSAGNLAMNSKQIFIYLQPVDQEAIYLMFSVSAEKGGSLG